MNGTPTGIGVNLGTSGDLLIYLEGGGACFNDSTCGNVAHPSGWGPDQFGFNIGPYNVGIVDRLDDANPFRDATYVVVPYCTGDVHAGSKPDGIGGRKFVGYTSGAAVLFEAAGLPTDPSAEDDGFMNLSDHPAAEFIGRCRQLRFWDRQFAAAG